jgi:hypothetical protein
MEVYTARSIVSAVSSVLFCVYARYAEYAVQLDLVVHSQPAETVQSGGRDTTAPDMMATNIWTCKSRAMRSLG